MLISHAEKTNYCNAESKFKVSETNIQRRRQQKVKLIQTPPKNVQWIPHMGNSKNQNKKLSLALKKVAAFQWHETEFWKMNSYILSQSSVPQYAVNYTINGTGKWKKWVTIILAVSAQGIELLPYVIFNHKIMSKEQVHNGIIDVHLITQVKATTEAIISSINIDLVDVPGGWPHNGTHLMVNKPFKGQPNRCVE